VNRILENIPDLKSLGKVQLQRLISTEVGQVKLGFEVFPKEFEKWKADKEEIGAYKYNYSRKEITIEANRGAVHENTIGGMLYWFGNLAESNKNLNVSLREGTLVHPQK
jgi:hypothetical protein